MQTRETLLDELRNLAAGTGPDITLFKFHEATGIHPCHIYRKWGNWTTLRLAAGLPPRSRIAKVYSDDHLFQELNRTGTACSEFPTISAFGRFSQRCWATLSNRFGRRSEVWRRYFSWLQQHEPAQRPAYVQDLPPDVDPATVPGVTSHRSADARQQAIDDYNEQRLYLHESLLGPPPPGWKPGPPKLNEANWTFDVGPGAPGRLRRAPNISPASTLPIAAERDIHDKPISESAPVPRMAAAAESDIHDKPKSESAATGPAGLDDVEQLTPEEWNAFYNHPKAFPIVDINAGLFPRSPFDGRDPADPRPNPPPWERNFEPPPDPDSEPSLPHAVDGPPASTRPPNAAECGIHDYPISESAAGPREAAEWDLYFKGLWVLMIATTVALAEACRQADELLFSAGKAEAVSAACAKATCGKLTHEALYVHTAGLETLPPILRVFEGCARNYVGVVDDANLVKLHRFKPKVSYLAYPEFDGDPHPALVGALVVPLDSFDVKYWNYADSPNPPILHRKEEFVPAEYPGREKFARLTQQEERAGLFEETLRIGRREEWRQTLENKGVLLKGHRLIRNPGSATGN